MAANNIASQVPVQASKLQPLRTHTDNIEYCVTLLLPVQVEFWNFRAMVQVGLLWAAKVAVGERRVGENTVC